MTLFPSGLRLLHCVLADGVNAVGVAIRYCGLCLPSLSNFVYLWCLEIVYFLRFETLLLGHAGSGCATHGEGFCFFCQATYHFDLGLKVLHLSHWLFPFYW